MRQLKATFDILYERKRLLSHEIELIKESIKALQTVCKHEHELFEVESDPETYNCIVCGKTIITHPTKSTVVEIN